MPALIINHKIFNWGDIVILNAKAQVHGIAPAGTRVELFMNHPDESAYIGLYAVDGPIAKWNDLEGEVDNNRGWWILKSDLQHYIDVKDDSPKYITSSFNFKGVDLKDKGCKICAFIDNTDLVFVEFAEDIGGCSADGLGKRGHCAAVPKRIVKDVTMKKTKKES